MKYNLKETFKSYLKRVKYNPDSKGLTPYYLDDDIYFKTKKVFDKIDLEKALQLLKQDILKIKQNNGLNEDDELKAYEMYEAFIRF